MTDIHGHIDKCFTFSSPHEFKNKESTFDGLSSSMKCMTKMYNSSVDDGSEQKQEQNYRDHSQSLQSIIQEGFTKKAFETMLIRHLDPTYYRTYFED